jgi:uncharacterized secreted protein with C-terminal beta-propeller domain
MCHIDNKVLVIARNLRSMLLAQSLLNVKASRNPMKFRSLLGLVLLLASTTVQLLGCATDQDPLSKSNDTGSVTTKPDTSGDDQKNADVFESDFPGTGVRRIDNSGAGTGDDFGTGTGTGSSTGTGTTDDVAYGTTEGAASGIDEADIFKLEGDRLYVVSRLGGLSIVDVSQRDNLKLLGLFARICGLEIACLRVT